MWWTKKQTLLVITRQHVARLDYRSGPRSLGTWTRPRPAEASLQEAVALAIQLHSTPLHTVWILAEDVWSGVVALAHEVVQSIPASALSQAIAFELEYDSGLDPFSTRLAYVPIPGNKSRSALPESQWWTVQVEEEQLQSLTGLVAGQRGRLSGVAALGDQVGAEVDVSATCPLTFDCLDKLREDQLSDWGLTWLRAASDPHRPFPLINLNNQHWTDTHRQRASRAILACALCACGAHYTTTRADLARQQAVKVELQAQQKRLSVEIGRLQSLVAKSTNALGKVQHTAVEEQERLVKVEQERNRWKQARRLPAELLAALEATASPQRCITSLNYSRDNDIVLQGIGVANEDVMALVVQLEVHLNRSPWTVLPPRIQLPVPGGPVLFSIQLRTDSSQSGNPRMRTATRRQLTRVSPHCDRGQGGEHAAS